VVVTKYGKPVAELRPYSARRPSALIGLHHSQLKIRGDIVSPLNLQWKALEGSCWIPAR
jgi:antitoxin (DNA-binding transcriptional repressor) of toxin-antitoxin stability system